MQGRLATQGDRKKIRQQLPVSCASAGGLGIPCKPHITPSSITMLYACMGIRLCINLLDHVWSLPIMQLNVMLQAARGAHKR